MVGSWCGIQLRLNPFPRTVTKEVRVPGGYMNHWLVRAFVQEPIREMVHDRVNNIIYCDPLSLQEIKRVAAEQREVA